MWGYDVTIAHYIRSILSYIVAANWMLVFILGQFAIIIWSSYWLYKSLKWIATPKKLTQKRPRRSLILKVKGKTFQIQEIVNEDKI